MASQKNDKKSSWQRQSANVENPFILVPFSRDDLGGYDSRGGKKTEFVVVDNDYRRELARALEGVKDKLIPQISAYPQTLGPMVFRLREKAIAKSHRPIDLVRESGLVIAGHGRLDEMIVASSADSFDQLDRVIRRRNTKSIRANLSALLSIESWTRAKKNPEGGESLRKSSSALIRLFRYGSDAATIATRNSVFAMLEQLGISFELLHQRKDQSLVRLSALDELVPELLDRILDHPGIRAAIAEPFFVAPTHAITPDATTSTSEMPQPSSDLPVVGVFDTGVSASATSLLPWVLSSDAYVFHPIQIACTALR